MSIIADFFGTTFPFGGIISQAKKAENNKNSSSETNVNPNNVSYKDPIVDSFGYSQDKQAGTFKNLSTMFLVSFCLFSFPDILLMGIGMYLFAKQHESFKDSLEQVIKQSSDAFGKLNKQVNNQPQNTAQPAQAPQSQPQQTAQPVAQAQQITNPQEVVKPSKTVKPLTPLEIAQKRYSKAEDKVLQCSVGLKNSTIAADEANRKLHKAETRLEKAKHAYEKAKEETKPIAQERFEKATVNYAKKYTEAGVANERVDVAKAKLEEAKVKLDAANLNYEKLKAEEIVDVSAVNA